MSSKIDEHSWEIDRTVQFIVDHGYKRVALQLPDDLLRFSPNLAACLTARLGPSYTVAVLADTAFNAEAVDEVAARHMHADCVVHYGRASLAAVSQLPVCYVFPRLHLHVDQAACDLAASLAPLPLPPPSCHTHASVSFSPGGAQPCHASDRGSVVEVGRGRVILLLDQGYLHALEPLAAKLRCLLPQNWLVVPARPATTASPTFCGPQPPQCSSSTRCGAGAACCAVQEGSTAQQQCAGQGGSKAQQQCAGQGGSKAQQGPEQQGCCSMASRCGTASSCADSDSHHTALLAEKHGGGCPEGGSNSLQGAPTIIAGYAWHFAPGELPDLLGRQGRVQGTGALDGDKEACTSRGAQAGASSNIKQEGCKTWYVWVGPQAAPSLQALQLALSTKDWLRYTPACVPEMVSTPQGQANSDGCDAGAAGASGSNSSGQPPSSSCQGTTEHGLSPSTQAQLKRRYFLVEKAKEASIVGILVGTLAVAGLKEAMTNLRRLIAAADKHSYTMLVGKPNPTKLANFPEVDVWVLLADPLGYILDSKPFLAPILTPYEALLALTGQSLPLDQPYLLDLQCLVEVDPSQVAPSQEEEAPGALVASGRGQVARLHGGGQQLSAHNAAEYLQMVRSFKGLEAPVAGAAPKVPSAAVQGQHGRAAVYRNEGATLI